MADDPKNKLSPQQKENWNKFIDFVALQKMAGHPSLDARNKQVGMGLIQKYNFANPKNSIDPNMVTGVQREIQDYRNNLVNQWKSGKAQGGGIKSEEEIMPGISQVDGWPGSRTLSTKFPTAVMTKTDNGVKTVQNYGTDTEAYAKNMPVKTN